MTDETYQIINLRWFQLVFESRHAIASLGNLFEEVWVGMMQGVTFAQARHFQSGSVFKFHPAAVAFFACPSFYEYAGSGYTGFMIEPHGDQPRANFTTIGYGNGQTDQNAMLID